MRYGTSSSSAFTHANSANAVATATTAASAVLAIVLLEQVGCLRRAVALHPSDMSDEAHAEAKVSQGSLGLWYIEHVWPSLVTISNEMTFFSLTLIVRS